MGGWGDERESVASGIRELRACGVESGGSINCRSGEESIAVMVVAVVSGSGSRKR